MLNAAPVSIKTYLFGHTEDGRGVNAYELENKYLKIVCLSYGAILAQCIVKDEYEENNRDIVLGYETMEGYEGDTAFLGATVGRCVNRIAEGRIVINGKTYNLEKNNGHHHLHGGSRGCHTCIWDAKVENQSIVFTTEMKEEQDHYPGTMKMVATYSLKDREVIIHYRYQSDKDSMGNPTNHTYFCLDGVSACTHDLTLYSEMYTPADEELIPLGTIRQVAGTAMDFREEKNIGSALETFSEDLKGTKGYDHNYLVSFGGGEKYKACGTIRAGGIEVTILSDAPAFQLYTGNWLQTEAGKEGVCYTAYKGLCIEPQFVPNAINVNMFYEGDKCIAVETPFMHKGKWYERTIVYHIERYVK